MLLPLFSWSILKLAATWWFSRTERSLYRTAKGDLKSSSCLQMIESANRNLIAAYKSFHFHVTIWNLYFQSEFIKRPDLERPYDICMNNYDTVRIIGRRLTTGSESDHPKHTWFACGMCSLSLYVRSRELQRQRSWQRLQPRLTSWVDL